MDVYCHHKKIVLSPTDFQAQGGEGRVYVKNGTAFKVYDDPAKAVPPAKLAELSVLAWPQILCPQAVLCDRHGTTIGYTMPAVPDSFPLCRLFARSFRDRFRVAQGTVHGLARQLQEGVTHIHSQGLLLVDLNETNFLVDVNFGTVFFIDVDSYQTPHFPATALMDSVRDRHNAVFSTGTDWFSYAIVSFQLLVGIHPYKGKHPDLHTLEARMAANVSIFSRSVSVPAVCPPLSGLPPALSGWYYHVLEQGERCPPPGHWDKTTFAAPAVSVPRHCVSGAGAFHVEELETFQDDVLGFAQGLVVTQAGVLYNGKAYGGAGVQVGLLPHSGGPVAAWVEHGRVRFHGLAQDAALACDVSGEAILAAEGHLFIKQGGGLLRVEFLALPSGAAVGTRLAATVMPQATVLGESVLLQNVCGACYIHLPDAHGHAPPLRLPELDAAQWMEAKYQNRVLMVTVNRQGRTTKLIFRFDAAFGYDVRTVPDVTGSVNFAVLRTGVCLHLTDDGALELFSHRRGAAEIKTFTDPTLTAECRLMANAAQALFGRGRTLYRFSLNKTP